MKATAWIVPLVVLSTCCGFIFVAEEAFSPNSATEVASPVWDRAGLPASGAAGLESGGISDTEAATNGAVENVTSAASWAEWAESDKPWGVAILSITGLTGGLGIVAIRQWMRWKQFSKRRSAAAESPKVEPHTVRVDRGRQDALAERQLSVTRRAA